MQWEERTCDYLLKAASELAIVGPSVSQHLAQRLHDRVRGTPREEILLKAKNHCRRCSRVFVPFFNCAVDFSSKKRSQRCISYICECGEKQVLEKTSRKCKTVVGAKQNNSGACSSKDKVCMELKAVDSRVASSMDPNPKKLKTDDSRATSSMDPNPKKLKTDDAPRTLARPKKKAKAREEKGRVDVLRSLLGDKSGGLGDL